MITRLVSGGANVTKGIGEAIGRAATGPLAIMLVGDYGTGKTTFVQGLAVGLGIVEPVRSPSYNIMKRYDTGRFPLVHADLYRTRSNPDIEELGILDILTAHGILAIEWPGRYLPPVQEMPNISINFSYPPGGPEGESVDRRNLEINWVDDCPPAIVGVLRALAAR